MCCVSGACKLIQSGPLGLRRHRRRDCLAHGNWNYGSLYPCQRLTTVGRDADVSIGIFSAIGLIRYGTAPKWRRGSVVSRIAAQESLVRPQLRWSAARSRLESLTEREYEVLSLLGDGLSNHRIAVRINVKERTVRLHVSSILEKLQIESRLQAGLVYVEHVNIQFQPVLEFIGSEI
jgi:DNA-binding CsgD family transcriptional regulator